MSEQKDRSFFDLKEGETVVVIKTHADGQLEAITLGPVEGRGFSPDMKHLEVYYGLLQWLNLFRMCDKCGRPLHGLEHTVAIANDDLKELEFCGFDCALKVEKEHREYKRKIKEMEERR